MSSVQERLQLKRTAVDKWNTREHLCLASAVSCSGDQNWMSVSRTIKLLCGSGPTNPNRPADWFSQKSCAVQYGELLENAETPKRKKRLSESNQTAETPTESILRKLTQERISELKIILQQEQDEHAKLCEEILAIQNGSGTDDDEIRKMYLQIEIEEEQKVVEQQKYSEWLKKREERKLELQRQWRPFAVGARPTQLQIKQEELSDSGESLTPKPQGTSPLLTSLLKSQSPAPSGAAVANTPSNVRAAAPTITNLLTGGTMTSVDVIAGPSTVPQSFNLIQSRPLTGPPSQVNQTNLIAPSPSQTAPTLSMLLENKNADALTQSEDATVQPMDTDGSESPNKDELMEVFQGLMDENMDELADILTDNNALIPEILDEDLEDVVLEDESQDASQDLTETSVKDFQHLSEQKLEETASKNDNFQKLIEQKNSILQPIDEEPEPQLKPDEMKLETEDKDEKTESENSVQFIEPKEELQEPTMEIKQENLQLVENQPKSEPSLTNVEEIDKNPDISDDSVDITIFNEIANEIKEKIKAEDNQESKESSDDVMEILDPTSIESDLKKLDEETQDQVISGVGAGKSLQTLIKQKTTSESSDVIIIHEDEDSNEKSDEQSIEKPEDNKNKSEFRPENEPNEKETDLKGQIEAKVELPCKDKINEPTTITIIDTDDDSTHLELAKPEIPTELNQKLRDSPSIKNLDSEIKKPDDLDDSKQTKDRGDSESPFDETMNESMPRTRRRYSSTPALDSIPNSPASSIDAGGNPLDAKIKKSLLLAYNNLISNKNNSVFLRSISDEQIAQKYQKIILRPMDLQIIKKNIENGTIRSINEFQRDIMLISQNAIMFYKKGSNHYKVAKDLMMEIISIGENQPQKELKKEKDDKSVGSSGSTSSTKGRGASRKSLRLP